MARMFMLRRLLACCLVAALCQVGISKDLRVPQQYATIQTAITNASNGDRILISAGVFRGLGNVNLDFQGKAITIQGAGYLSTIIDGQGVSQGFIFHNGESASSVVRSLTIKRCKASAGAGVSITGASPLFLSCTIEDCAATTGGAVYINGGQPSFQSTLFNRNHSVGSGGAIYSDNATPILIGCAFDFNDTRGGGASIAARGGYLTITSCAFKDGNSDFGGGAIATSDATLTLVNNSFSQNASFQNGGAIDLADQSKATVTNCTFAANLSHRGPGAFRIDSSSNAKIQNSILWSDAPSEIQGKATVAYTCITGGHAGQGNTAEDPNLVDAIGQDLHLSIGSSCVDKADAKLVTVTQDQEGHPRSIGTGPDMGAYEFPIKVPTPTIATSSNTVFTVPHDGNPNTNTADISIRGTGYDAMHGVLAFQWTVENEVVSSKETVNMKMEVGQKRFDLQVRDSQGDFTKTSVFVKVLPEPNAAPTANAGANQTVTANNGLAHVALHGRGYDSDGDELSYHWSTGAGSEDIALDLPVGNHTFTFTIQDPYGAKASSQVTVRVLDGTGPIVTLNSTTPMPLEVFSMWTDPGATATDETDGSDLRVQVSGTVNTKKLGSYMLTYSAKDSSGNTGSKNRTVNVVDTTDPVITLKGDNPMDVDCAHGYSEPGATATDNYDGDLPVTISGVVSSAVGSYTVTYTVTDSSGNKAIATRTVNVTGSKAPVLTLKGTNPMTLECATGYTEPGANAVDGCSGASISVVITGTVSSEIGTYTVTYTATDSKGQKATATRTVTVSDTAAPIITLNGASSMTVECGTGYTEPGATATDACDAKSIPVTISGTVAATKGTYTVTYTATDSAGNKSTAARTVTVADTTAPVITLKGATPMNVECGSGYVEPGATATDSCDGASVSVSTSGTVSVKGTYTITYTATDKAGNKATATRTVKVVDTTAPVIALNGLASLTVECGTGYTEFGAVASDVCDGTVSVTTSGTVAAAKGMYTITYTAKDNSGNTATTTRTVTVADTTPPVITLNGASTVTIQCGSGYSEPSATANDSCDGNVAVTISGTVSAAKGSYTITYTAKDGSNNTATATRAVVVSDTIAPTITLKGSNPMTVTCGSGYSEPGATAIDTCDGSVAVVITGFVLTSKGTYSVTYKATDSAGNQATATRTVNVTDTTAPVLTLNGSNPMTVACGSGYSEPGATATDTCDGSVAVVITGSVLTSKGSYTVTYKATDSSGNQSTATRTVNVIDTTAPVITLNGSNPMTVDLANGIYLEPGATATDACDGSITVSKSGSVLAVVGTYTVTYTATDSSGNTTTRTRTVNVTSSGGPTITGLTANPSTINSQNQHMKTVLLTYTVTDPADPAPTITVTCTSSDPDSGAFSGDVANDIQNITATSVDVRQEHIPSGQRTYTITVKVTDKNGKTASASCTVICK